MVADDVGGKNQPSTMWDIVEDEEDFILSKPFSHTIRQDCLWAFIRLARYKFAARYVNKGDVVLDAGCGDGLGSLFLSQFAKEVYGVDTCSKALAYCLRTYKRENLNFEERALQALDNQSAYDVVVCMDVIEHFSQRDASLVIHNFAKVLRPSKGMLILGTPNVESQRFASEHRKLLHLHEYSADELREMVEQDFHRVIILSMNDELVHTGFHKLAWYLIAIGFGPKK